MPPPPGRLIFGRCRLCQRAATMRGDDWTHDPGDACALLVPPRLQLADGTVVDTFLPVEPFDPIRPFWRVEDPQALYLDLPTMPRREAVSAARLLLRRYTPALDEIGVHLVAEVLAAAERARLTDDPVLPSFDGSPVSSDYAPVDNDESDVDDGQEDGEWTPVIRQEATGERRPRRLQAIEPPVEEEPEPEEEWDDSAAPTTP